MSPLKAFVVAATLTGSAGLATAASASPISPAPLAASTAIEHVAFGCGPGFTRGRFGRCHPIFRRYGYGPRRLYGPRRFYGRRHFYRRFR